MDPVKIAIPTLFKHQLTGYRIGFSYWSNCWLFAHEHFEPSYWMILKREGFEGNITSDSEELLMLMLGLDFEALSDLYFLHNKSRPFHMTEKDLRSDISHLILSGRIRVFSLSSDCLQRLSDADDPLYAKRNAPHLHKNSVASKRHELAEVLGKDIVSRWLGKDKADRLHWDSHMVIRELKELADIGGEVVDTVVDTVVGLWDIATVIVTVAGNNIMLTIDVAKAALKFQQKILAGDVEAIKKDLTELGIAVNDMLDSTATFLRAIDKGLTLFNRLINDPRSRTIIKDYFDSLFQSTPYRDTRTMPVRVISELGIEVLLAIATAGVGTLARRAASTGTKISRGNAVAKRIGPFTPEAIDTIADLSQALGNDAIKLEALPSKPKSLDIPEYAKPNLNAPSKKIQVISKLTKQSDQYAELVNSNKPWSWKDFPEGESLTIKDKRAIKADAIKRQLIPDVKYKTGTKYPDFKAAGLIKKTDRLPEELWKESDYKQFKWLDKNIPGGQPEGYTWHHSEIPGQMELVPFGPHNTINHQGGRSIGHWAHAKR